MQQRKSNNKLFYAMTAILLCVFLFFETVASASSAEFWFDEGIGATAHNQGSGGNHDAYLKDGTNAGDGATIGPKWDSATPFSYGGNSSLYFDGGTDWVDVGPFEVQSFTIEAWVKPQATTQALSYIAQAGNENGLKLHFRIEKIAVEIYELAGLIWNEDSSSWTKMLSRGGAVSIGEWQHLAMVYDTNSGGKIYINGNEVGSMGLVKPIVLDRYWRCGQPFGSTLVGWLDEFRVSDLARIPGDGSGTGNLLAWNESLSPESSGLSVYSVSPRELDFGIVELSESRSDSFRVVVTGTESLCIDSIVSMSPEFAVEWDNTCLDSGDTLMIPVTFTPTIVTEYRSAILLYANESFTPDTLPVLGSGLIIEHNHVQPLFSIAEKGLRATYIIPGSFKRAWAYARDVRNVYANTSTFRHAIDISVDDIKSMGFNSIVLSSFYFPSYCPIVSYPEYCMMYAVAGEKYNIGIIPSFIPDGNQPGANHEAWVESGELCEKNQSLVDTLSQYPAIIGFNHAFEAWGQTSGDPSKIRQLKDYIEGKDRFYCTVPAAGTTPPENAYTVVTAQLNPKLFCTQAKMDAALDKWNDGEKGVEINLWHSQILPEYGYVEGEGGFKRWETLQRNAILKYRPKHITSFTYQHLIADFDPNYYNYFYTPRGFVMNVLAKLDDETLLLYDPGTSKYSTEIISGRINGGSRYYGSLDASINRPNIDFNAGSIMMWMTPEFDGNDGQRHVFFSSEPVSGANYFRLQKNASGELSFEICGADGLPITVNRDVAGWQAGERHHVAAAWDESAGSLSLTIDGQLVNETSASWNVDAISDSLCFGSLIESGLFPAGAVLEEMRIYGSASEISMLPAPTLQSPANNENEVPLETELLWEAVDHAVSYRVQVCLSADFDSLITEIDGTSQTSIKLSLEPGTLYFWRVATVNPIGIPAWSETRSFTTVVLSAVGNESNAIQDYCLYPNFPNPFNGITTIQYDIPKESRVKLVIYNVRGEQVDVLSDGLQHQGTYTVHYDTSRLSSGLYFYALQSESFQQIRKFVLLK